MKNIFKFFFSKQTFSATDTLEDGTQIQTEAEGFVEGAEVFVVTADGENIPAPDGEYKLSNGDTITVAEGKITAVTAAEKPAEEAPAAEAEVEAAEEPEATPDPVADILAAIEALTKRVEALEQKSGDAEAVEASLKTQVVELSAKVTELGSKPAAVSLKRENVVAEKPLEKMSYSERVMHNVRTLKSQNA